MSELTAADDQRRRLRWAFLGRRRYAPTYQLQEHLRREISHRRATEHLLLLEHDPVFTLGRGAARSDIVATDSWLRERAIEIHKTNRGGQVTYHGPGQLVGYPIINLDPDRRDVRRYVRDLQEILIRTLRDFGVEAGRREGKQYIGVWVGDQKIASIGVHLARWITIHGFALNVATDLSQFAGIVACGLPRVRMTSIERLTGRGVPLAAVAACLAVHAGQVFDRRLETVDGDSLLAPAKTP